MNDYLRIAIGYNDVEDLKKVLEVLEPIIKGCKTHEKPKPNPFKYLYITVKKARKPHSKHTNH